MNPIQQNTCVWNHSHVKSTVCSSVMTNRFGCTSNADGQRMKKNVSRHALCALIGALLLFCGCAYRVPANARMQGEMGYQIVDAAIKRAAIADDWGKRASLGANETGFTAIRRTGVSSTGGQLTTYANIESHKWTDIEDIKVQYFLMNVMLCGLADPTWMSTVRLTLKNGDVITLKQSDLRHMFFPTWLISNEWRRSHVTAQAFQSILEMHRKVPTKSRSIYEMPSY